MYPFSFNQLLIFPFWRKAFLVEDVCIVIFLLVKDISPSNKATFVFSSI